MMMVKGTTGQLSATPNESLALAVDEQDSSVSALQHQLHQEPLTKSTTARHKLKFTSSGSRLWQNIGRKRSASHGSSKVTSSNMADELVIDDSDVILQDSVQLTNCLQTQQRYLFLLSSVLIVAKQKSSANFHAKDEIRLSEIWLADCINQVSEIICDRERSFVIGWPTVNLVATFASVQLKDVWLNRLQQQIALEKSLEWPPNVVIKIVNTSEAFSVTKSLLVQNCDEARDILTRCVQEMHISLASVNDFQFWVQSEKENHPYPLFGHEYPYAIQMNYIREKQGSSESVVLTDISLYDGLKFQIVLMRNKSKLSQKLSLDETRTPKKPSTIMKLFKKSSRSVEVGNIFGRDISALVDDDMLCAPVMDILSHLFVHGPFTVDIFRKSAIVSKCHEAKQHLDHGGKVDFNDIHVGVSAALLKELLRCLPNCLLLCELYSKWIKISAVIGNHYLANHRLKSLVQILPRSHQVFLRYLMCILHHISLRSGHNGMTAYSLAVCISPSLLWPRSSSGAALSQVNDAKKLNAVVEQMIESAGEIFGPDCLHLFDHLIPQWNWSQDVVANVLQRTNLSLDIVKEESLIGDVEQDVSATFSATALGLCSSDVSPTSTCYDSGMATSNSLSYSDVVVTTALVDCHPAAEADASNDTELSAVTPISPLTRISRVEMKKCKIECTSDWFHAAFEDDSPSQSSLESAYRKSDVVCGSLPESCISGTNCTGRNLSAEIGSETELMAAGTGDKLDKSVTDFLSKTKSLSGGTEPASEDTGYRVLHTSSSLDESWNVRLSTEQEVEKNDLSLFGVEENFSALDCDANKSCKLTLRSVSGANDFRKPSSETVHLSCPSISNAAFLEQASDASLSFDVPDSERMKRREGRTGFVTEADKPNCSSEHCEKKDEILCTLLSFGDILRREQPHTCVDSYAVGSKASCVNLRRGMTKCGSDIFPTCFLEGLHCTFGEVLISSNCEEEELTGKSCGLTQPKSSMLHDRMRIPHLALMRPRGILSEGHQFNSVWCQVVPSSFNSAQRVRPANPPSYAEAIAAKVLQNGAFSSSPPGLKITGMKSHSQITESHPMPPVFSMIRDEEGGFPVLPSGKSILRRLCKPAVPTVTVVTCSMLSHASQSDLYGAGTCVSTTIHCIPSTGSKTISAAASGNSEAVVTCVSKPLSTQNPDVPNELSCDLEVLPQNPVLGSAVVSTDHSNCSVNCLSQGNSEVRNDDSQPQTGACAFVIKQRLNQRVRKQRQHSSDPKLHTRRAFGLGLGRSKSDSSEILEKKRQECNFGNDKENVLAPSNSFLKRKLAAMKRVSKEDEYENASHCSSVDEFDAPYNLTAVSEINSTDADYAEREPAYSPRDMKKKKSLLFERCDRQNEEATIHSTPLNPLSVSNSLQHEMTVFRQDEFSEVRIKTELPHNRKMFNFAQPKSFKGDCVSDESFNGTLNSSDKCDSSVLESSLASSPSEEQYSYVFRAAKTPIPDAIKINSSVSRLKRMYGDRGVPQSGSVAYPQRMIALHDTPHFV